MNNDITGSFDPVSQALSMPTNADEVTEASEVTDESARPARQKPEIEIETDDAFSYEGYQVVRGEFFAHVYEPSITFNNCKVSVNTACVNKLPDVNYVQILVNPDDMKLAVRPCSEDEKDSFLWCTMGKGKKKPKQITCRMFFAKIIQLMDWNPDYRYKMLGKLISSGGELLFVFDMTAPEIYQKAYKEGEKPKASRTPTYPAAWQNQFGLPVEEHRKSLQINIFEGYAVFGLKDHSPNATETEPATPQILNEGE